MKVEDCYCIIYLIQKPKLSFILKKPRDSYLNKSLIIYNLCLREDLPLAFLELIIYLFIPDRMLT